MSLKFRTWDKTNKYMIEPALEEKNIGLGLGSLVVDERAQTGSELIWMQFTGLTDNNTKDIYVGDIVRIKYGKEDRAYIFHAPVIFRDCKFTIDVFQAKQKENSKEWVNKQLKHDEVKSMGFLIHWDSPGYHSLFNAKDDIEVVGNIYENGDPLK